MIPASRGETVGGRIGQSAHTVGAEVRQSSVELGGRLPRVCLLSDEREARVYVDIVQGLTNYVDVTIAGKTVLVYWKDSAVDVDSHVDSDVDSGTGVSNQGYLMAEVLLPFRVDAEAAIADMEDSVLCIKFPRLAAKRLS